MSHHRRLSSSNNSNMQTPNQLVRLLLTFLYNTTLRNRGHLWNLDVKAVGHDEHAHGDGWQSTCSAKLVSLSIKDDLMDELEAIVASFQGGGG